MLRQYYTIHTLFRVWQKKAAEPFTRCGHMLNYSWLKRIMIVHKVSRHSDGNYMSYLFNTYNVPPNAVHYIVIQHLLESILVISICSLYTPTSCRMGPHLRFKKRGVSNLFYSVFYSKGPNIVWHVSHDCSAEQTNINWALLMQLFKGHINGHASTDLGWSPGQWGRVLSL